MTSNDLEHYKVKGTLYALLVSPSLKFHSISLHSHNF